jgi:hypothetical protein
MSSWMPDEFSTSETEVFHADAESYPGVRGHGLGLRGRRTGREIVALRENFDVEVCLGMRPGGTSRRPGLCLVASHDSAPPIIFSHREVWA